MLSDHERKALRELERQFLADDPEFPGAFHAHAQRLDRTHLRGRGHVRGTVFGSVSQSVLRHGHSPLAIIRHDGALAAQSPAGRVADSVPEGDQAPGPDKGSGRWNIPRNRRWSA